MAIREIGSVASSAANGGDLALDLTTITGLAEGDLVIAAFCIADTSDRDMVTLDANTWTEIVDLYDNDTEDVNLGVFYRYMTSSIDTAVTIEGYGNASAGVAGIARAFRGVATVADGGPFDAATTTATGTGGALADPPSITHTTEGAVIVIVAAAAQATSSPFAITAQSMYKENLSTVNVAETFDPSLGLTHAPPLAAAGGATDLPAFTNANSAATNSWAACTIALQPALPLGIYLIGGMVDAIGSGADLALTLPTNLLEGDLVIVVGGCGSTTGDHTMTMDTADYTTVADLFANDTIDTNMGVFYKFMGATPDTTAQFNGCAVANDATIGAYYVFRGVAPASQSGPFDVAATTTTATSTAIPNAPSIDWSGSAGRVAVVAAIGGNQTGSGLLIPPANSYYDLIDGIANGVNDASIGVMSRYDGLSDPEDPGAFTFSAADNIAYSNVACTMMLKPYVAPTGGFVSIIITGM